MRSVCIFLFSLINLLASSVSAQAADSPASPDYLRCEYRVDPLGIDVLQPRLFWEMSDARRGAKQTAYQILVAGTPEKLAADQGDLWDSGKVASDQSAQVVYAGKPLAARQRCHWKVRLWDADGKPTSYSKPALWSMGLLKPADVKAKWIGLDRPSVDPALAAVPPPTIDDSKWIWTATPGANPKNAKRIESRYFRRTVTIPEGVRIRRAVAVLACGDLLYVNGGPVDVNPDFRNPQAFDVTRNLNVGKNCLAIVTKPSADLPAGFTSKLMIELEQGEPIICVSDGSWKCATKLEPNWNAPGLDDSQWPAAVELGKMGDAPWGKLATVTTTPTLGCPLFRKEFSVTGKVLRATVYGSSLGNYRLHINGRPVGNDYFTPDWTDYNKRVYYNTYDVTDLIRSNGPNAIGGVLAGGWYSDGIGWENKHFNYGDKNRLLAQLEIELADGTIQTVATDGSWRTTFGPYIEGEFLAGETYDATKEIAGWASPGLNDAAWQPVAVTDSIAAKFQAFPGVTVQETGMLKPIKITEPRPGAYVFDLGQNFAGFARLKARGPAGTKIVMRFAETLNPDRTIYTANLRGARALDTYVLKGDGEETWQPRFTFHGFRYVEVIGYPGKPTEDAVTGIVINSNVPLTGSFECSSPMVNRLYQNIVWTQRANYISVPTDCPQRDERLGWTGDAETFVRAATYNADVGAFFTKWLVDLEDAQGPNGDFPNVAPRVVALNEGSPAWADAGTICPMTIYYVYNDRRLLEKHYAAMPRWVEYCRKRSKGLLRPDDGYGDWLSINAETPKDVLSTAFFAHSTWLTARAAEILGKADDARKYDELFRQIKEAFNKAYVAPDGRIKGNTQTCYVLALAFNLLPDDQRPAAVRYLVDDIKQRDAHLSTGFVGTAMLMPTLSAVGQTPLGYKLLLNESFPSWGYSVKQGATSIWERWDGWTAENGFQDPIMNSLAHYSFGAVGQWMFRVVAGIDTAEPGFQRLLIRPQPAEGLTWLKAGYRSMHGRIATEWKNADGRFTLDVVIPANTTATVHLPVADPAVVTEGGQPVQKVDGVKFLRTEGGESLFAVGAGEYHFAMPPPK